MKLDTSYLGLTLRNPVVASSSAQLSLSIDQMKQLADAGVGAIVMYSLFEEELRHQAAQDDLLRDMTSESFAEALNYFPDFDEETPESLATRYLRLVEQAASTLPVPIIASLNGSSLGSWVQFAKRLQDAGAAAIECNTYFVAGDVSLSGPEVEQRHIEIAQAVADAVSIPVSIKLTLQFSSVGNLALRLANTDIKGLVLFARPLQPDIDIDTLTVAPTITLSRPADANLPRMWIAALRNHMPSSMSLAASSGVETYEDVVKYLLAGADVVMTASALIRHGAGYAHDLVSGLEQWMTDKQFTSIDDFRGLLAVPIDADANAYERGGYVTILTKAKNTYGSLAD